MHSDPQNFIFTEDIDYLKTGEKSIWGIEDPATVKYLLSKEINGKWLDFAAGDGRFSKILISKVDELIITDLDESALKKLTNLLLIEENSKVKKVIQNIVEKFPFEDSHFDGVFNTGTLHLFPIHILDRIFKEVFRILKPNGEFIFDFATDIKREKPDGTLATFDEAEYTLKEALLLIELLLKKIGFKVKNIIQSETIEDLTNEESAGYIFTCKYFIVEAIK
jgi:SAM-dependent methyltransferase